MSAVNIPKFMGNHNIQWVNQEFNMAIFNSKQWQITRELDIHMHIYIYMYNGDHESGKFHGPSTWFMRIAYIMCRSIASVGSVRYTPFNLKGAAIYVYMYGMVWYEGKFK